MISFTHSQSWEKNQQKFTRQSFVEFPQDKKCKSLVKTTRKVLDYVEKL